MHRLRHCHCWRASRLLEHSIPKEETTTKYQHLPVRIRAPLESLSALQAALASHAEQSEEKAPLLDSESVASVEQSVLAQVRSVFKAYGSP